MLHHTAVALVRVWAVWIFAFYDYLLHKSMDGVCMAFQVFCEDKAFVASGNLTFVLFLEEMGGY